VLKALAEGRGRRPDQRMHFYPAIAITWHRIQDHRRYELLKKTLLANGMSRNGLRLVWASAAEGVILADRSNQMVAVSSIGTAELAADGVGA